MTLPPSDSESADRGPVDILLVRHGESVRNHATDLARHRDFSLLERQMREESDESEWPLTDAGHRQAIHTGDWIRGHLGPSFDAAYVSPFLRTRQTAADLRLGVEWTIDERLREREWGDYLARDAHPYSPQQYLADLGHCSEMEWRSGFSGGESVRDLVPHVTSFLQDAWSATPRGRIIAVTHGGTIHAFQAVLESLCVGVDCPDHRLTNCCAVHYRLQKINRATWQWEGCVQTVHPALPNEPETEWEPIHSPN